MRHFFPGALDFVTGESQPLPTMDFRSALQDEFQRRRRQNPRYSLRAFAHALGTHHRTLSQILRGRRRLTMRTIRRMGSRLLPPSQVAEACIAENCSAILCLVRQHRFRPDARWIAVMAGIPLNSVSIALHRLLHEGRLSMRSTASWVPGRP